MIATWRGKIFMLDRRALLGLVSAAAMAPTKALCQQPGNALLKRVRTGTLEIAYEESGPAAGFPVLLMHGFPYDPRCYDEVVPSLVADGYRAIVPYLRGLRPHAVPRRGNLALRPTGSTRPRSP
jgi:hypothetical protein